MNGKQVNIQSELRWQCRRGMLELDLLLNAFLEDDYNALPECEKTQFALLLEYPDQTLFDLLLGKMQSSENKINTIVNKINKHL